MQGTFFAFFFICHGEGLPNSVMDELRLKDVEFTDADQRVDESLRESEHADRSSDAKQESRGSSEIEPFFELLRQRDDQSFIRTDRIRKLSRLIENGEYETEERLDQLADRLLEELL